MEKLNEDLYKDEPTVMELVEVIRSLEKRIRELGPQAYTAWLDHKDDTWFNTGEAMSWRDLKRAQLEQAIDDASDFVEQVSVSESLNEEAFSVSEDDEFLDHIYRRFIRENDTVTIKILYMQPFNDGYKIKYEVKGI